jgi:predicted ATPase
LVIRKLLTDAEQGLEYAREIGQAASLMYALYHTSFSHIHCGSYAVAKSEADELVTLTNEKDALFWKAHAVSMQGCLSVLTGNASEAVDLITSGIAALRPTGARAFLPWYLSCLARAGAELGRSDEAIRSIRDVVSEIETAKEKWCEAEVSRIAGEVALKSPEPDAAKAEAYFERALGVARQQQAKSWELRASMSLARLWRDQGKPQQARELSLRSTAGSLKGSTRAI